MSDELAHAALRREREVAVLHIGRRQQTCGHRRERDTRDRDMTQYR
jgi:hypothetical protein